MIKLSYYSLDKLDTPLDCNSVYIQFISPWGLMGMRASIMGISNIFFLDAPDPDALFVGKIITPEIRQLLIFSKAGSGDSEPIENMQRAINYINGENVNDDIYLCPACTDFQFSVFEALLRIPSGTTVYYKDIAKAIDHPTATRAVATAVGRNDIAVLIPCHRVIPASGGYGEYRWGSYRKRTLIAAEKELLQ